MDEIDHHRHAGDVGLGGDEVEELHHGAFGIEQAFVHIDVDDLRAVRHLIARDVERRGIVAVRDELAELRRTGDIGALADIDEGNVLGQREGLQSRQAQHRLDRRYRARSDAFHGAGDRGDMVRRRAAAAAKHIDETGGREFADERGHIFGAFVIKTEFVGQAGVGVGADERIGDAADLGDMRAHLAGAERAVEADRQGLGVASEFQKATVV